MRTLLLVLFLALAGVASAQTTTTTTSSTSTSTLLPTAAWYIAPGNGNSFYTLSSTAGVMYCSDFTAAHGGTFTYFGGSLTGPCQTGGSSGSWVAFSLYSASSAAGTRITTTGALPCESVGPKAVTVPSFSLIGARVYRACVCQSVGSAPVDYLAQRDGTADVGTPAYRNAVANHTGIATSMCDYSSSLVAPTDTGVLDVTTVPGILPPVVFMQ